jgi:valyl-tRNA synthetase
MINAVIYGGKHTVLLNLKKNVIMRMARIGDLKMEKNGPKIKNAVWKYIDGVNLYLPVSDFFDVGKEIERLGKKLSEIKNNLNNLKSRLDNKNFLDKAPVELVQREKSAFADMSEEMLKLEEKIKELCSIKK